MTSTKFLKINNVIKEFNSAKTSLTLPQRSIKGGGGESVVVVIRISHSHYGRCVAFRDDDVLPASDVDPSYGANTCGR